jgi:hypothetical protein
MSASQMPASQVSASQKLSGPTILGPTSVGQMLFDQKTWHPLEKYWNKLMWQQQRRYEGSIDQSSEQTKTMECL